MDGERLFGGKRTRIENLSTAIFWEEKYTLPDGVDKTDWLQVVANRTTTKQIIMELHEFHKILMYSQW